MSSTRSAFRPAPVTEAPGWPPADWPVILVGHGSPHTVQPALDLGRLAQALGRLDQGFATVEVAMLNGSGERPADVVARLAADRAFVVPVMMCDGQTVRREIPKAFAPAGRPRLHFCPPVGTHPGLAALIATRASEAAQRIGAAAKDAALMLIAHGSLRNPGSEQATTLQARRLARQALFRQVVTAYIEQPPRIADTVRRIEPPVIAVGLFAAAGRHATRDVESALAAAGRADVIYLGPIGSDPGIAALIASLVHACDGREARATNGAMRPPGGAPDHHQG